MGSHRHPQQLLWDAAAPGRCSGSAPQADSVTRRKSLSGIGQPKADLQAGEEEEDLQTKWISDIRRVCGAEQARSLCAMSIGGLGLAFGCAAFSAAWGSPWGAGQEHSKGDTPQVTFSTQVRVKFWDNVRIICIEGKGSLRRYFCNF